MGSLVEVLLDTSHELLGAELAGPLQASVFCVPSIPVEDESRLAERLVGARLTYQIFILGLPVAFIFVLKPGLSLELPLAYGTLLQFIQGFLFLVFLVASHMH